jgi:hypothetical protein
MTEDRKPEELEEAAVETDAPVAQAGPDAAPAAPEAPASGADPARPKALRFRGDPARPKPPLLAPSCRERGLRLGVGPGADARPPTSPTLPPRPGRASFRKWPARHLEELRPGA